MINLLSNYVLLLINAQYLRTVIYAEFVVSFVNIKASV